MQRQEHGAHKEGERPDVGRCASRRVPLGGRDVRTSSDVGNYMNQVAATMLGAAALLVACSTPSQAPSSTAASLSALESRHLHLPPKIDPPLQGCPVTNGVPGRSLGPFLSNLAVGSGPVYPLMYGSTLQTATPSVGSLPSNLRATGGRWRRSRGLRNRETRDRSLCGVLRSTARIPCASTLPGKRGRRWN